MVAIVVLAFVGGLVAGSFATAVAHRVPRGLSIAGPRSQCAACGSQIAAYDNVPVVSWLLLRGRARCCGTSISPRYPLTELALGLLFVATVLVYWDEPAEAVIGLVFLTMLAAITLTDLEQRIIPNKILIAGVVLCLVIAVPTDPGGMAERGIAAVIAGGVFFCVALAYPRGMGLGDVKLAATMGLFLGQAVAPAILAGLLIGSVVGLALIARHGSGARKMAIPFGPFSTWAERPPPPASVALACPRSSSSDRRAVPGSVCPTQPGGS
jgi:leader peptidase (prepilin peptidase)/N-methyltransferase